MAKSKRGKKIIIFAVIVVAAAAAIVPRLNKKELPLSVQTDKVIRRNITEIVLASGKIQPVLQVKISPEVSGEIIAMPVKEGQKVKKGDLLLKIKPDNYVATRNSAEASYKASLAGKESAEASLEKASLEFKRSESLSKAKLTSESDFLTAKTTYNVAKTSVDQAVEQVEVARAALETAETDLLKTTIYSPLDGTISTLNSEIGERVVGTAMMAGTEIMTVADLNEMEARVDIGEMDVILIVPGQKVHLEVDSFKERKFDGMVTDVASSAKNNDTSAVSSSSTPTDATKFTVKIRIKQKENFGPGMSVSAEIETRYRTNALSIPIECVTTRLPKASAIKGTNAPAAAAPAVTNETKPKKSDEPPKPIEVVFVVEGDHVKMAPVTRGICDDNYVEIVDGLKEGQEVVKGGFKAIARELEDGKKITVSAQKADTVAPHASP